MINLFKVFMSPKAPEVVKEVLESGMIGEGPKVKEFKDALEKRFKCKNLIPLNSGTSALTLALRLAGVDGGQVITTAFTMIATNVAIKAAGAEPVFADLAPNSVNVSYKEVKEKITPKTKAIILTLVGGIPMDLEKFKDLNIPIIIDAAHAIDTYYEDEHISHWGDFVCFSFQSIKQLTTGDGGALVCRSNKEYDRAEKLKWFGMSRIVPEGKTRLQHQMTADVEEWGYKMHMNDISASIGLENLKYLDSITAKQRETAHLYNTFLDSGIIYPLKCNPSWWAFPMLVENRDEFIQKMEDRGIECSPMWRRNDEYSVFKKADLPNMEYVQNRVVFVPVGWWLSPEDRAFIVQEICDICK